ncbi:MAG: hypothetical protein IMY83_00965 [Chloroflexi bacterium]|nr:hypothetical protein [Chloroflexota bacterium]
MTFIHLKDTQVDICYDFGRYPMGNSYFQVRDLSLDMDTDSASQRGQLNPVATTKHVHSEISHLKLTQVKLHVAPRGFDR